MKSKLSIFFVTCDFGVISKKLLSNLRHENLLLGFLLEFYSFNSDI